MYWFLANVERLDTVAIHNPRKPLALENLLDHNEYSLPVHFHLKMSLLALDFCLDPVLALDFCLENDSVSVNDQVVIFWSQNK